MKTPISFSICIPQYGRSRHLMMVLDSIRSQTYPHFEVAISDDCSKDDTAEVIPAYLEQSGMRYRFHRQQQNLGYDTNLRSALGLGTCDYLLVLGNDDALADDHSLADLAAEIERHDFPEVVLTNFREWTPDETGAINARVPQTALLSGGPETAIAQYRTFSFVGGIAYSRDAFRRVDTPAYDGSVFVQTYIGCKIIADGGRLLLWDHVLVAKDVRVDGTAANCYKDTERQMKRKLEPHSQGLSAIAWVAAEAALPALSGRRARELAIVRLYRPLLQYTYPYWLYAHRREGFRRAELCMVWGCYPPILLKPVAHSAWTTIRLLPTFLISTLGGALVPLFILERLKAWGSRRSKRLR